MLDNFFDKIRTTTARIGGSVHEFAIGNIRRARELLGDGWRITTENHAALRTADNLDVTLRIKELDDRTFWIYRRDQARIIERINSILTTTRTGWRIRRQRLNNINHALFFSRREIRFTLYRTGTIPIKIVIIAIGGLFILYGILITGISIVNRGREIFGATGPEATPQDIRELVSLLPPDDRARAIETYIEEITPAPVPGLLEQLRGLTGSVIALILIGFAIYLIVELRIVEKISKRK